jgi:signal peptidase I
MTDQGQLDDTPEYKVGKDQYLAMGDNRDNSLDSRVPSDPINRGVGMVPAENLVGRAEFLFFSTNGEARLWEFWRWPIAIRFGRLFQGVR